MLSSECHSKNEDPTPLKSADNARILNSALTEKRQKNSLGQFMTPASTALFMAKLFCNTPEHVKLLDPAAGMGALIAAYVTDACSRKVRPKKITVVACEVDVGMKDRLKTTLMECSTYCSKHSIEFEFEIHILDFITTTASNIDRLGTFNRAILNPPYGKIHASSHHKIDLENIGIHPVNLYSAFVLLSLMLLEKTGELVAITPRSFCNGTYFRPYRKQIFSTSAILDLHLIESRKQAFKEDAVLQENVIFRLSKGTIQKKVNLSSDNIKSRMIAFKSIVLPNDDNVFIRLPLKKLEESRKFRQLPCSLVDLGISVSTGKVVDFRLRGYLRKEMEQDTIPLIYPAHISSGNVQWPIDNFKKHNAILTDKKTEKLSLPSGNYVLVKRFSSKEEKRRIVAATYSGQKSAFENRLNYFHIDGKGLPLQTAKGLSAFLNSAITDEYFRTFSGHTQVNATDLRSLPYPSRKQLLELAKEFDKSPEAANQLIQSWI